MAQYLRVASVTDIPNGSMKVVSIAEKRIAIAHIDEEFFAIDDTCTHEECSLGNEGFLDGIVVTCGCHGAQFDISSGDVLALPATVPLKTYPVEIRGLEIFIEIS